MRLYPPSAFNAAQGASVPCPPHVDEAVKQIHAACKGLGTDEQALIAVLGSKSPETRNLIGRRYQELYGKPLRSLLRSETSGDFGRLLAMVATPLPETEAQILRDATKGIGTNESLIVQILSGRTNEEMTLLKRTYFDLVGRDLAVTLNSELSGDFRKVVMALLQAPQGEYNPQLHNAAKAEEEATTLYKAGQGRLGTNEEVFIGTIVKCPPEFLKMVDAVYVAKYNNNIAKAVDKEFSGDAKRSLNFFVRLRLDPYPAIAELFERTMKGFGTDETGLSTALVRYQSLLPEVKVAYKRIYREELRDRISGETSGDYKKLLLEIFDAPRDPPVTGHPASTGQSPAQAASAYSGTPAGQSAASGYPAAAGGQAAGYAAPQHGYALPGQVPPVAASATPTQGYQQPHGQPQAQQPTQGYPPQQQQQPQGYAAQPQQQPQQQQQQGYPPPQQQQQQPQQGYPPQQQQQQQGYPPQQQQPQQGYPPQQQPQQQGYPPQQQPGAPGYPPQQQHPGYSHQQSYQYPPQQQQQQPGYPAPQGYPPQQPPPQGYPPQQPPAGYPPYQYPPQQPYQAPPGQYPPQQQYQYPPPQNQYPPPQGYPPQYPPPGGYPPYGY